MNAPDHVPTIEDVSFNYLLLFIIVIILVIPQVNSLPAQFDKEETDTEGERKESISKHSSIHVSCS